MKLAKCLVAAGCLGSVSGCSGIIQYADGPVLEYVNQPIPKPTRPLARTASLSIATWGHGGGFLYCDMLATPLGTVRRATVPPKFADEIYAALKLDEPYADAGSRAAFDIIVDIGHRERKLKRELRKAKRHEQIPGSAAQAETLALVAWEEEAYATAHSYTSAAKMRMKAERGKKVVRPTAGRVMESMGGGLDLLNEEYRRSWEWLHKNSGAIGPAAPEGTHLNIFILDVFDFESFKIDSRSRVAVLLVLVDSNGETTALIRGSDFLICKDECTSVSRKPSAKEMDIDDFHDDVKEELQTADGLKALTDKGFYAPNGRWQYLILHHALGDLAQQVAGAEPADAPQPAAPPEVQPDNNCAAIDPTLLPGESVPDQAWGVAQGHVVCVVKADGTVVHGELIAADDATATVLDDGGKAVVVQKAEAAEIRIEAPPSGE